MQSIQIARWLMYFYIYCFLGWIWESCYVSVKEKRLVNRGFMKGPLLPIYGSGAVSVLLVTLLIRGNYILMAVVGMAAASVLEYVTGAVMEALFKVRYWDYSTEFLNLSGYICLKSTLCWGIMTFLVTYGIHPPIADLVEQIPENILQTVDYAVTALAAADFATSFKTAIDFRNMLIRAERLKEEMKALQARMDELEHELAERARDTLTEGAVKAKNTIAEGTAKAKNTITEGAARAKDTLTDSAARAKDTLTDSAARAKDTLAGGAAKTKDTLAGGAARAKDTLTGGAARAKDTLTGGAARAKGTLTGGAARAKDTLAGGTVRAREQILEELQELKMNQRIRLESLRSGYSRSVHGLLKRNPSAKSRTYSETMEQLKKAIRERIEGKQE